MTPEEWYKSTIGRSYDTDNYPRSNPYQCWDYFDVFCRTIGCKCSRYCAQTGYVGDLWSDRYRYGYYDYFDFVLPNDLKEGDWIFWKQHVAFYYDGKEVGQNQNGRRYVSAVPLNKNGILGGMRYKFWDKPVSGVAENFSIMVQGKYHATTAVNMRTGGSIDFPKIIVIPKNGVVDCYGYFHEENFTPWLYVTYKKDKTVYTGFVCSDYLSKD